MKAAIFDLDGTLLDSMPVWKNVGADYLRARGITPPEGLREKLKTMSFRISAEYFINEFAVNATVEELMQCWMDAVAHQYYTSIELKPFVSDYLKQLQSNGIRMCVATATDRRLAEAALNRLGIRDYFEFVLTVDEVGRSKEFPDIFMEAARRLNCRPHECVIFEDSFHALQTIFNTEFIGWGVHDASAEAEREQLLEICDRFIWNFKELISE
jgi:haloacid dehalogenase superfamily, subfamily IA, variant 3 with third motif having DD or ED/haloacid dehalogenase superfamily, subfamily IA, variant 1 with third motif having Dx(3-4)D or Dx(3-4)E